MIPIVYVETNWVIACLFPHDERYEGAKALLAMAEKGDCALRVPLISFIEAHGTMNRLGEDLAKEISSIRDKLRNAIKAGWTDFDVEKFTQAVENPKYFTRNLVDILEKLKTNPAVTQFSSPPEEIAEIGKIGLELKLYTPDMKDLYILSAIVVDLRKLRQQEPRRPALFLSHNEKEFGPKKSKVPQAFYDQHLLHYWSDFKNLRTTVGAWRSKYTNT